MRSDVEKEVQVNAIIDSAGYGSAMAEFYGVVLTDKSVFRPGNNIVDKLPHHDHKVYSHMFFSYDEADSYDNAAIVIGGIYDRKLYIIDSQIIRSNLEDRWKDARRIYDKYKDMVS
jgi:hypothetical protein